MRGQLLIWTTARIVCSFLKLWMVPKRDTSFWPLATGQVLKKRTAQDATLMSRKYRERRQWNSTSTKRTIRTARTMTRIRVPSLPAKIFSILPYEQAKRTTNENLTNPRPGVVSGLVRQRTGLPQRRAVDSHIFYCCPGCAY